MWKYTIWSKENEDKIPPRYYSIYTIVLPFKLAAIFLYGVFSINTSIPSIDKVFGPIYGDIWSWALAVTAIGAFVGLAFYDRWIKTEALALVCMLSLMLWYVACIFIAGLSGMEDFRILSLLLVLVFLPMPSWRLFDIVRELRPPRV